MSDSREMNAKNITINCVHPNVELYGSDRSFIDAIDYLSRRGATEIVAVIPHAGPIADRLSALPITLCYEGQFILRKASILRDITLGLPRALGSIFTARKRIKNSDLTYVNTCVVINYLIAASFTASNLIVHVREIPDKAALSIFRALIVASRATVVFNSEATRAAFKLSPRMNQFVVPNGFSPPRLAAGKKPREGRVLNVLCIGRINGWKGQNVLINALALLSTGDRNRIFVRIVGSVYDNQTHFLDQLHSTITQTGTADLVSLEPFMSDPSSAYEWADVVVVPSTKPEPFGRVAIEAMAYGKVVIAAAHGGLVEILDHGSAGILVPPNDPRAIAEALESLLQNPGHLEKLSEASRVRFEENYTVEAAGSKLSDVVDFALRDKGQ